MTMKKTIAALVLSLVALSGCTNTEEPAPSDSAAESSSVAGAVDSSDPASESSSDQAATEESKEKEPVDYQYRVNPDIYTIEPLEDANSQVALLTFDDAPQPPDSQVIRIAETVKNKGANAIFFVMGQFLEDEESKEIIRTVYDMGFEIGNHTYSHPDLQSLSYEEQLEQIESTNDLVEEITGERPRFLRAPYGQFNEDTENIVEQEKMTLMNWTYGYDWEEQYMNSADLADIMVNTEFLGNGANLLMHDRTWTADAIGEIMDGLEAKGYEFVDPAVISSPEREGE